MATDPESIDAKRGARPAPDVSIVRDDVRALVPFHVESSDGLIKLDAMENPFGLPAALARQLAERLARVPLNRYPPLHPEAFKEKLAESIGLPDGAALMLGNGSDELIHVMIQACARPGARVLSPWPSFIRYDTTTRLNGCAFVGVPLTPSFQIDGPATLAAIREHQPAIIFIASPNNPTANLFDSRTVEAIIAESPGLVVLDEAYVSYAQHTWLPLLKHHPNLLILRTFSKIGLAGIRLGYLCAHPAWLAEFEKVRAPYNVNALTLATAGLLLEHITILDEQAALLRCERERILETLRVVPKLDIFPSAANFVLFRVRTPDVVCDGLKRRGVLVKNVSRMHPLLAGCVRATVGSPQENDVFLAALKEVQEAS